MVVIVWQINDLCWIVDEFLKFVCMLELQCLVIEFRLLVQGVVILQESGLFDVWFNVSFECGDVWVNIDDIMIGQVLINLIKNVGEVIEICQEKMGIDFVFEICVILKLQD